MAPVDHCRRYAVLLSHLSLITVRSSLSTDTIVTDTDTAATVKRDKSTALRSSVNCPSSSAKTSLASTDNMYLSAKYNDNYQLDNNDFSRFIFAAIRYFNCKYMYSHLNFVLKYKIRHLYPLLGTNVGMFACIKVQNGHL